jgi:hypothetical protein
MTRQFPAVNIACMKKAAKPGRRLATPTEFKAALAQRVSFARENAGLNYVEIAARLTEAVGREISADTYRKWEGLESSIPHDVILPFCDITKTHPYLLLAKPSEQELPSLAGLKVRTNKV